jgi:alkanesulfonate monooxygenase
VSKARTLQVFSTAPQSRDADSESYAKTVREAARWSEAAGCDGMLVYADNGIVDPWLVAQLIIEATDRLSPLVAVQPVYMHPYSVAKMVSSLAYLHGRRVCLNMVAGGFRNDLLSLGDETPHDERYARLVEYVRVVEHLLTGQKLVSFSGRYYRVEKLRLTPPIAPACLPGLLMSGSSSAGLAAAQALKATPIKYPRPSALEEAQEGEPRPGMRLGIIARPDREEAWRVAYQRFPEDRAGQIAQRLAMRVSDSEWHRQLSELANAGASEDQPYWLGPFQNYKTFCPYLVGDLARVRDELIRYMQLGFCTFILDIAADERELGETLTLLRCAWEAART